MLAQRHPAYTRTVQLGLRNGLTGARVTRFLLAHHNLHASLAQEVRDAYRLVFGFDMDPLLGYSALIDPETQKQRRLSGNHQALTTVGRALLYYGLSRRQWQLGKPITLPSITRSMSEEIVGVLDVERLRQAVGFTEPIPRQPLHDTAEAVIATACLHLGYEGGLNAFATKFDEILARLEALRSATIGDDLGIRVHNVGPTFDPVVDYATLLQALTQAVDSSLPVYQSHVEGPSHKATIVTGLSWRQWRSRGTGPSKSVSRQQAAFKIISQLLPTLDDLVVEARIRAELKEVG